MTIDSSAVCSLKSHHDVCLHMSTWSLRMDTWNTQKIAAIQVIRMRRKTTTHGTRCWRRSRCLAPAQRYNRACRIGRYAGWHCRATLRWTSCTVVSKIATAEPPKKHGMRDCAYQRIKVWKAWERVPHAQPHCEKCACVMCNGKPAVRLRQKGMWPLSGWDKAGLCPSTPRTGPQYCLSFA